MTLTKALGTLADPVLICGGAYGNLQALEALIEAARRHGVPAERIIHSGDAVAYCADPRATAERLRGLGAACIKGNVEEQLGAEADDCACGFEDGSACDVLARSWYAHARREITPDLAAWMDGLPLHLTFFMSGRRVRVVHGSPGRVNRFMWESLPAADFAGEIGQACADVIIAGHTGVPFTRVLPDGRVWHNSGGLGMVANDGTPRVWYSIAEPGRTGPVFSHHALDYDYAEAAGRMRAVGLPEGYALGLESGLWPSLDILPEAERARTGHAIDQDALTQTSRPAAA
ncbi:MAG: metallophosphoesterase [Pseudomonadota bacterium]